MLHGSKENSMLVKQTPRCMYPSIFNRFPVIELENSKVRQVKLIMTAQNREINGPNALLNTAS